jgi:peptidoglycan/xylan/chitin deacetylase (PgdA/CDA1 family)
MTEGLFLLTLDTELLWDRRGQPWSKAEVHAVDRVRHGRFEALLSMLDELDIPATFALVGHLLIQPGEVETLPATSQDGGTGRGEPAHWYESIPRDFLRQREGLYWPELVPLLKGTLVSHEIACHTLTHRLFDETALPEAAARFEIDAACRVIARAFGKRPTALVFPRNLAGHLPIVAEAGIKVFRGKDPTWWGSIPGLPGKLAHLLDRSLALTPPVHPQALRVNDLTNVPGSMLLLARSGLRRVVPLSSLRRQAMKGVAAAIRGGCIFHLWLHPVDLGYDNGELLTVLRSVLEVVATATTEGRLRVATMSAFAGG